MLEHHVVNQNSERIKQVGQVTSYRSVSTKRLYVCGRACS